MGGGGHRTHHLPVQMGECPEAAPGTHPADYPWAAPEPRIVWPFSGDYPEGVGLACSILIRMGDRVGRACALPFTRPAVLWMARFAHDMGCLDAWCHARLEQPDALGVFLWGTSVHSLNVHKEIKSMASVWPFSAGTVCIQISKSQNLGWRGKECTSRMKSYYTNPSATNSGGLLFL